MNFKEALIAHLQGEKVEANGLMTGDEWGSFAELIKPVRIGAISDSFGHGYEFRLAPRTIIVNGVEVPAPEINTPVKGSEYFIADPFSEEMYTRGVWTDSRGDRIALERSLVYLTKENAIARSKVMLITKEV